MPRTTPSALSLAPVRLSRPRAEAAKLLEERIRLGRDILNRPIQTANDLAIYKADDRKWMEYNYELLKTLFTSEAPAREYRGGIPQFAIMHDERLNFRNSQTKTTHQITKLESILERLGLYPEPTVDMTPSAVQAPAPDLSKVFVVHGHDESAREGVARFLERIGLEAIILAEQPNRGRTIIEKFMDYAREVGFAVVLLTPDDLGGATADASQKSRVRQNVIFELGYFVGSLGRGRACLLRKGEVEIPSDLYGVVYTTMDSGNGWKIELARELKDAGFEFDADKVLA
jgi:predicted nucleotide-binding protein